MTQYHVTLNGQGYLLALDRYAKRRRQPFAAKRAEGAPSVGDLAGPEQVLAISDWSAGEGYVQQEQAPAGGYRQGSGVNVYAAPGFLQLGPAATLVQATTESLFTRMAVFGGQLYIGSGSGTVYRWNGVSWSSVGVPAAGAGQITALEVFEQRLYAANSSNGVVGRYDGAAWSAPFTASPTVFTLRTTYRQAAQYLYVGVFAAGVNGAGRLYYWDGGTLSAGQLDPEESTPFASIAMNARTYFAVGENVNQRWSLYSVDNAGSGGNWTLHARAPGSPTSAAALGDVVYFGDQTGGRIWAWDGSTLSVARELATAGAPYMGSLAGLATWAGALWVGIVDGSGTVGLLRYDPAAGSGQAAWSRPVSGLPGTDVGCLAVFRDELYVGTVQAGAARVYRVSRSTYGSAGSLESGLIGFGLPGVPKLLRSVTVVASALASGQSVQVEYRLDEAGSWLTAGTLATVGATTATYSFPAGTTCRQLGIRLTLAGSAGASSSPTVHQVAVRYVPRPSVLREWDLAVVLEGTSELPLVTIDGEADPLTGAQLSAALWTAAGVTGPVGFVDLDGSSYSVYVDDVREEVAKVSQRHGYQRVGLVRLVEAA